MRCRWLPIAFGSLYAAALGLLALGTWGLFGQMTDPLSGVFLIPLGMPWLWLLGGVPDTVLPWVAVVAPSINLGILLLFCRRPRPR